MSNLSRQRAHAFRRQQGRCCYCDGPMWLTSPSELPVSPRSAKSYQCTAEHLVARQLGGRDDASNIAAACWLCNQRRHRRKVPPCPDVYRALVQRRLAQGRWRR